MISASSVYSAAQPLASLRAMQVSIAVATSLGTNSSRAVHPSAETAQPAHKQLADIFITTPPEVERKPPRNHRLGHSVAAQNSRSSDHDPPVAAAEQGCQQ